LKKKKKKKIKIKKKKKMNQQQLISLIEDKIKTISIFEVLNCNDDIQKEI